MGGKKQTETEKEQKIVTKYDRKMEEKRKREEREKRESKMLRIGAIVLCVAIVAAVAGSITVSVLNKQAAVKKPYVTVGDHVVTRLEYDYYYHTTLNSYLTTYSSLLPYIGYDPEKDPDEQQYSEDMTWKDMFDQMTVGQIQQTKALLDDAAANGFTYDGTEDYDSTLASIKAGAEEKGVSLGDYYADTYGEYATESNIAPFLKDNFLVAAYYDDLMEKNAPSADEIKAYYEEHKKDYDKVDYRSFVFAADVPADEAGTEASAGTDGSPDTDEADKETERRMLEAKKKADAMLEQRKAGEDFETLCLENASGEDKENYKAEDTEYSLSEGKTFSGTPSAISEWLYEDGRAEGDSAVIEDETNHQYYVVEFVKRYYDDADDASISNTIASERVTEYVTKLTEGYAVTDNKGELKYLKAVENAQDEEESPAEETEDAAKEAGK